jgi:hypothetical protein
LRVFTPFWRRVQSLGDPPQPLPAPKALRPAPHLAGDTLENWGLEPTHPDWTDGLRDSWTPGEISGQRRLREFLASGAAIIDHRQGRGRALQAYATVRGRRASRIALTALKIPLSLPLRQTLGDDMDDDTPVVEPTTDATTAVAEAPMPAAKPAVKKKRKAAKKAVKAAPKKAKKAKKAAKKSAAKKSAKKAVKKAAKKTAKKASKKAAKKKKAKKSKR